MDTPLIITPETRERIKALCAVAQANAVNARGLAERLRDPEIKAAHKAQMTRQTIEIPLAFLVTFSIEYGHPVGVCRHMSMSVQREGRLPNPAGIWMVAQEFGFWGNLRHCVIWLEELTGHGQAVNVVQPVGETWPAQWICHWPGEDVTCCDFHRASFEKLGDAIALKLSFTPAPEGVECVNCKQEQLLTQSPAPC